MPTPVLLSSEALRHLQPGQPVLVGFSGGPDSAALLHALHTAGWPLVAAHLDHALRPSSAADAQAAAAQAAGYGIPFVSQRIEVAALAVHNQQSLEAAARAARYAFLFAAAQQHEAQAVLVAHTADDQAETLLMHLLRGAGPGGLRGMPAVWLPNPWSATRPLVRPLLGASRRAVLDYVQAHGLAVLHDPSNDDPAFFRNRLRHELLPHLEQLAPGAARRLLQTGELLAAEDEAMQALAAQAWRRSLSAAGPGYLGLRRAALLAEPLALQRRVLQQAARQLRPQAQALSFGLLEQARAALAHNHGAQDWFDGLELLSEVGTLWLAERGVQLPAPWPQAPITPLALEAPTTVDLGAGWHLHLAEGRAPQAAPAAPAHEAWLPATLSAALQLRRPVPGERIALAAGTQKLSDLFINAKLPQRARAAWPLLCYGDAVVWAPGLRLAHGYAVQPGQPALHAQILQHGG